MLVPDVDGVAPERCAGGCLLGLALLAGAGFVLDDAGAVDAARERGIKMFSDRK